MKDYNYILCVWISEMFMMDFFVFVFLVRSCGDMTFISRELYLLLYISYLSNNPVSLILVFFYTTDTSRKGVNENEYLQNT